MNSFIYSYPGFQTLPRGIKQMLVTSEDNFFKNARPTPINRKNVKGKSGLAAILSSRRNRPRLHQPGDHNPAWN